MEKVLGMAIEWLMAAALVFGLSALIMTSIRAMLLTLAGKDLVEVAEEEEKARGPGRAKSPLKPAQPRFVRERAADATSSAQEAFTAVDETAVNAASRTSGAVEADNADREVGSLADRLAADFDAELVPAAVAAGPNMESRDISQ